MCSMGAAPRVGDRVDLVARLPGGEELQLPSTVRHVSAYAEPSRPGYRVGFEFDTLDEVRARLLEVAINSLASDPTYLVS